MDPLLLRQHLELEESHWWFVGRRKIVLDVLEHHLKGRKNLQVLDAGCGGGATMDSLRQRYGYVRGVELSEEAVAYSQERGRDVVSGSIEDIPFAGESYDLALALDVIEHVPDDLSALQELSRVLRPEGYLLITVPALQMLWSEHDVANGHYRRYALNELHSQIEEAGFEIITTTYFNSFLFPLILIFRWLRRLNTKSNASDVAEIARPLNTLLTRIFSKESVLVGRVRLPFGVSAMCVARKPERADT